MTRDQRVGVRPGTRCPRCGKPHWSVGSTVCEACWLDMGQMSLWEEDVTDPREDPFFERIEDA